VKRPARESGFDRYDIERAFGEPAYSFHIHIHRAKEANQGEQKR